MYLALPGVIAYALFELQGDQVSMMDEAYPQLVAQVVPAPLMGFFAAVMLGALLGGAKLRDACVKAGEFVRDTIAYTAQQGTDPNFGVQFEKLLPYLWQK